ncbi:hypothetical protein CFC21_092402 [Triticum aestivum]|uniref:Uncharacterized protein n=2 Tax=Triticum aestivum TaxID=4565 RepID=A0A3B6QDR6_WHEAT|nr:protein argonaute PNH1-like [Triticum aestivum]KAF7089423.1 hypothetical protein CFC21_092402 [Triticum aestivum]
MLEVLEVPWTVVGGKAAGGCPGPPRRQALQSSLAQPKAAARSPGAGGKKCNSGASGPRRNGARARSKEEAVVPAACTGVVAVAPAEPPPVSSKGLELCRRPGFGRAGTRCVVKANHFLAEVADKDLTQYDVKITPEVRSRSMNRAIVAELVRLYRASDLGMRLPAYDGRSNLYTAGRLPFDAREFVIRLAVDDDGVSGATARCTCREKEYKVAIKFAAGADLRHLREFMAGRQPDEPQGALQVLDVVLREVASQRYLSVRRSFYSPDIRTPQRLGDGLQSWFGFYQSIRPTQMGLSLNIDMSSTAFVEPLPVIDFAAQIVGKDVMSRPLSDANRVRIKKALRDLKVEITHRGSLRRKYRVFGLTAQPTHELIFPIDDEMKSVVEYFTEMYGFTIKQPHLPCLLVGNQKKPNYLPMEACKIVEGQRYKKRLNEKQITSLLKVTCQRPGDKEMDIRRTVHQNGYDQDPYAKEFGINISDKLTSIEARVLPAPWLKYHDTGKESECLPRVGQWDMKNKKVVNGCIVNHWASINFSRSVQESTASGFCQELAQTCKLLGMEFNSEPAIPMYSARPEQAVQVLKHVYNAALKKLKGKELELLLVILPDNNGALYGDIKRICETELGLMSQCCLAKHVFKICKRYLANVSLKINVKMGGRNTILLDAVSRRIPLVSDIPTIIFGADVTHPETREDNSPSIAAVVASQDWPEVTKYAGLVCAQAYRQELIQDLYKTWHDPQRGTVTGGMIRELLISFRKATGQKPLRIIFYRDGISAGQFHQVLLYELDAIRKACASLEPNYQPPVTFVIVQKRHHTKLFANNHNDKSNTDKSGNILPGTVVDSKICHPTQFDFYLCSHAGIQGTSKPAHYHVLWDENNFTADEMQTLTNNLCYTYARCTRSVSVVPPVYYAHLAAFRARFYMDQDSLSVKNANRTNGSAMKTMPAVKERVKRVMFYC